MPSNRQPVVTPPVAHVTPAPVVSSPVPQREEIPKPTTAHILKQDEVVTFKNDDDDDSWRYDR